jgi:chromosome segregation ATPase
MQNREAQRRFRERKEQRQKTLQQKAEGLQTDYQKLLDNYTKRTDEVCRLLKENDALRTEINNLRQRWRIMMTVLQQQPNNSSQLPSVLMEEAALPSSCSCSGRPGRLDDLWRRLERLTDDKPHSPS